ncbi:unnamed protein product [Phytophthora lilii]|uniref:Unnamed protein product n=1 Tax=Phytophthora lilii TaxID=2077276 RepID=A0A9W6TC22_9STRA|nr:unnamed protein product [Phytophthora lilii]
MQPLPDERHHGEHKFVPVLEKLINVWRRTRSPTQHVAEAISSTNRGQSTPILEIKVLVSVKSTSIAMQVCTYPLTMNKLVVVRVQQCDVTAAHFARLEQQNEQGTIVSRIDYPTLQVKISGMSEKLPSISRRPLLMNLTNHHLPISSGDTDDCTAFTINGSVNVYIIDHRGTGRSTLFDCVAAQATTPGSFAKGEFDPFEVSCVLKLWESNMEILQHSPSRVLQLCT